MKPYPPFVYRGGGKDMAMNYWTVPAEALESPALMRPWARLAQQAALHARAAGVRPASAVRGDRLPAAKARSRKTATKPAK